MMGYKVEALSDERGKVSVDDNSTNQQPREATLLDIHLEHAAIDIHELWIDLAKASNSARRERSGDYVTIGELITAIARAERLLTVLIASRGPLEAE